MTVPAARRYLPGTMVLETSWGTGSGWIIVRDVLLIGGWHHEHERSHTHRRAPTDYDADHVLLRTVRCVNGEVEVVLVAAEGAVPPNGDSEQIDFQPCGGTHVANTREIGAVIVTKIEKKSANSRRVVLGWAT